MSILQFISDIPINATLRLKAQALEDEVARLQKRCSELEERTRQLEQELASKTVPADFIEHRGALFKRRPDGGYDDDALCRKCRHPMVSFSGAHPYECEDCGVKVNFTGRELPKIMKELEAKKTQALP